MKKFSSYAFVVMMIAIPLASMAQAQVTGSFLGNGQNAKLAYLNARKGEAFSGEETVLLTFTEKDPAADKKPDFKAAFGEYGSALIVKITKSGKIYGTEVSHNSLKRKPFSSIGPLKIEGFKWDAAGVSGKLTTGGPDEFFDDKWEVVNLDFKAPVQ